jgi:hypothetical protein
MYLPSVIELNGNEPLLLWDIIFIDVLICMDERGPLSSTKDSLCIHVRIKVSYYLPKIVKIFSET